MTKYQEVLEKIVRQEYLSALFWTALLLAIIIVIWVSYYFYSKKAHKKKASRKKLKKSLILCRQSLGASIATTVIVLIVGVLLWLDAGQTVSDIQKDIQAKSYITYHGEYHIDDHYTIGQKGLYDRYWTVDFNNGESAFLYIHDFVEAFNTEEGTFNGRVVYGENSGIVVEMTGDNE